MSKRNKLLRWVNGMVNKTQPTRYCSFSDFSSDEDLYEDIENYSTTTDGFHCEPGTAEYNQYLREYFFALRDSHINRKRQSKDTNGTTSVRKAPQAIMVVDDDGEQCDQYQFAESELKKKRPRGNVCLPDRPRICVCSCETEFRRPTTPPRAVSWDAGWVFCSGNRDMRKLARRSSERLKDALFESGGGD